MNELILKKRLALQKRADRLYARSNDLYTKGDNVRSEFYARARKLAAQADRLYARAHEGDKNAFAQWEKHCAEAGHVTVAEAYDQGLIKSLYEPKAKKYAYYSGNPYSDNPNEVIWCHAPGCHWQSTRPELTGPNGSS